MRRVRRANLRGMQDVLVKLLLECFSVEEMRRFVRFGPNGRDLSLLLPGPAASPLEVAKGIRAHVPADHDFFERLLAERPRRAGYINDVAAIVLAK